MNKQPTSEQMKKDILLYIAHSGTPIGFKYLGTIYNYNIYLTVEYDPVEGFYYLKGIGVNQENKDLVNVDLKVFKYSDKLSVVKNYVKSTRLGDLKI